MVNSTPIPKTLSTQKAEREQASIEIDKLSNRFWNEKRLSRK